MECHRWLKEKGKVFVQEHPRSAIEFVMVVGASIGFGLAVSKVGVFVAVTVGVVFTTTAGAVSGKMVGEVLCRRGGVEYILAQV